MIPSGPFESRRTCVIIRFSMRRFRFSHTFLALQAAASGQGVALATSVLIGDALEAGRLVRPFSHELRGPCEYDLVCPDTTADQPQIQAFRRWVLEQSAPLRAGRAL